MQTFKTECTLSPFFTLGAIRTLLPPPPDLGVEELWGCGGVERDMGLVEGRRSDGVNGSWMGTRYESVRGNSGFIFLSEREARNNCAKIFPLIKRSIDRTYFNLWSISGWNLKNLLNEMTNKHFCKLNTKYGCPPVVIFCNNRLMLYQGFITQH